MKAGRSHGLGAGWLLLSLAWSLSLSTGCTGLLVNEGNDFPCTFASDPSTRDAACAKGEVCTVNNVCKRFVYEGPQFEGTPELPDFSALTLESQKLLRHPVRTVSRADLLPPLVSRTGALTVDGTTPRGFVLSNTALPLMLDGPVPLPNEWAQATQVAMVNGGPSVDLVALLENGAVVRANNQPVRVGVQPITDAAALRTAGSALLVVRNSGLALALGNSPATQLPPIVTANPDDGGSLDAGFSTHPVSDARFVPTPRVGLPPLLALSRDGFFAGTPDAGWYALARVELDFLPNAPRPRGALFRSDLTGTVWSIGTNGLSERDSVLSTWILTRSGEQPASMARAWPDCKPCGQGRLLGVVPVLGAAVSVEVLCAQGERGRFLVKVTGSAALDRKDPCQAEALPSRFSLEQLATVTVPSGVGAPAVKTVVYEDATGLGVLLGGSRGELWRGPTLSTAAPMFLDRVPVTTATVPRPGGGSLPLALTDEFLAAPVFDTSNGFAALDYRRPELQQGALAALLGEGQGWVVTGAADLARVKLLEPDAGDPFQLTFGPRLVDARGQPARSPFFGEAVLGADGGVVALALSADDSVYLTPVPSEVATPNVSGKLFAQLTPEPGVPIRSFTLERTSFTRGAERARGYLVTSRNLFTWQLSGTPARWSSTPLLLGGGEPVEVWMDNPRGGLGRVGYRDGTVFTLPGGFLLAGPGASGEPAQVLDYENLGGWPVAYATSGLWEAHYDQIDTPKGKKLDNKLPNGEPGRPMVWREVKAPGGATPPWMVQVDGGFVARPGRLQVVADPVQVSDGGTVGKGPFEQVNRLLLFLPDAVYEVGRMRRTNTSPPP